MALAAIGLLLVITPMLYGVLSVRLDNPDPAVYGQAGKMVLGGAKFYSEAWQDKPPLAILLYAVPQIVRPGSYAALQVFLGCCLCLQALMLYRVFGKDLFAASCAMLFVLLFPMTAADFNWLSTEHLSNLFVLPSLLIGYQIVESRRAPVWTCIAVGVLACAAFHIRQNAVLATAFPLLAIVAPKNTKNRWTALAVFSASVGVSFGLVIAWMAWKGSVSDYLYTVFEYPRGYASAWPPDRAIAVLIKLGIRSGSLPIVLATAAGMACLTRYRRAALLAVVISVAGCLLPNRPFMHYWVGLSPYIAVMLAIGVSHGPTWQPGLRVVAIATAMSYFALAVWVQIDDAFSETSNLTYQRLAALADAQGGADGTLFVCGPKASVGIQFASRLRPVNRFWAVFQLTPPWCDLLPKKVEAIAHEYVDHPPKVIVVDEDFLQTTVGAPESELPKLPNFVQILRVLVTRNRYTPVAHEYHYAVLVRTP